MSDERFLRISRFLGDEAVKTLHEKFVVIVGLGAVGGYAAEGLARSGIGRFRLIDFDVIGITNINRQILALDSTLGRLKTDVAAERIKLINPDAKVESLPIFAADETLDEIFADSPDLVLDCIDSLNPKCCLITGAYKRNVPLISSMGAALRRNPSLIRTADLMDTYGCPLAKAVRTTVRRRGVGRGIETVFSPELVKYEYKAPSEEEHADFNEQIRDRGRVRNVLGSLPTVTAVFGMNMAHLALTRLLPDETLSGDPAFDPRKKG